MTFSFLLSLLLLGGEQPPPPQAVTVREGITYAVHGGAELQLDLALPEGGAGPRPAVLFIHGGGWAAGNRKDYATAIREMAREGFVAATASYRFTDKAAWPAQLEDVRAAVRWLRDHAAEHRIDPRRI